MPTLYLPLYMLRYTHDSLGKQYQSTITISIIINKVTTKTSLRTSTFNKYQQLTNHSQKYQQLTNHSQKYQQLTNHSHVPQAISPEKCPVNV